MQFPLYVAETVNGERIAGPSTDCQRMMIAAASFERFEGVKCEVRWLGSMDAQVARVMFKRD